MAKKLKELSDLMLLLIKRSIENKKDIQPLSDQHKKRLKIEMSIISKSESLMNSIISFLKSKRIGGNINKPNSFVFYLLGITNKEPDMSKDFIFDFTIDKKKSRISPPDIDIDFEYREPILQHMCELYGEDKVALIGTDISFKPKAAIQFAAKALDITNSVLPDDKRFNSENDQEAKRISKIMPNVGLTMAQWLGEDPEYKATNKAIEQAIRSLKKEVETYPEVFEAAKKLEGLIKSFGTHAAGVVVSSRPITEDIPLHVAKVQNENKSEAGLEFGDNVEIGANWLTTQYDMEDVESIGLLKFDFLQLDNLRQMTLTENLIRQNGKSVDFDLDKLETSDPKVFKTIDDNKLEGLFQISGKAFRGTDFPITDKKTQAPVLDKKTGKPKLNHYKGVMEIIGCSSFDDIVAANALGRPGPLSCGMHTAYAEGKKDPSSITYSHPLLEPILKDTYSQMIYQEQMIQMAMSLAGFNFAEADKLRKACAKKKKELLDGVEPMFRKGCETNGIPQNVTDEMWNICVEFGEYAFNKSHSTAYAFITYQTAYLKTYYTTEFLCAVLTTAAQKNTIPETIDHLTTEYPRLKILPPNINKSKSYYFPSGDLEIIAPFVSLKGIGQRASDHLVSLQPSISLADFLVSVNRSIVDSKTITLLLDSGAFSDFGTKEKVEEEVQRIDRMKKISGKHSKVSSAVSGNLF